MRLLLLTIALFDIDPDVPPFPTLSVPVLIVVVPEWVLLPVRVRVPAPRFANEPIPLITPL
jgi:hypothetical protein